jgi:hypothetical protein
MAVTKDSVKRGLSDSEGQTPPPSKKTKAITTPQAPKWTEEEIKKLCDLHKSGMAYKYYIPSASFLLIYRDIVKYFPDRTPKALEHCYGKHSQSIGEMFSEEKVCRLLLGGSL